MPSISQLLKSEILRLARKQVRQQLRKEVLSLKATVAAQRSAIASLKKRAKDVEQALRQLRRGTRSAGLASTSPTKAAGGVSSKRLRFRAAGMAANRKRLGLSAADFGALVGVTSKAVFDWEQGKSKPKSGNLQAIAALRGLSVQRALQRLAQSRGAAKRVTATFNQAPARKPKAPAAP